MNAPKLTPWFPGHIKPVRPGVYQTYDPAEVDCFQFWNGKWWGGCNDKPAKAYSDRRHKSIFQNEDERSRWRGLAEEPK